MKKIALVNQKGGVAKTTSTYNLATAKAQEGKMVLMVDLDPQASLTISCGMEDKIDSENICHVLDGMNPDECIYKVETLGFDNLFLMPADIELANVEMKLITKSAREKKLKRALNQIDEYFDYCFIDCPPNLGTLTMNALCCADEVIIPVKTDYLSYRGLGSLKATIEAIKEDPDLNPELQLLGVIGTLYRSNVGKHREILELLSENDRLLGVIKESADVDREVHNGLPVIITQKNSDSAEVYRNIAKVI